MELGAIGELVGGVAVIASLLFVGLQLRQSNALSRADTFHRMNSQFTTVFSQLSSDAELAEIYQRALDHEELSPVHAVRFTAYVATFMAFLEDLHVQSKKQLFDVQLPDDDAIVSVGPYVRKLFQAEPAMRWWREDARYLFSLSFYSEISALLSEAS